MIDLHTHTFFSDGELIPSELIRRAEAAGYEVLGITDHVDASNIDLVIPRIVHTIETVQKHVSIRVIPGAEITHAPPQTIPGLVKQARSLGAKIVLVHGETIAEPVMPGTNRAAMEARADILAHPGLISEEDLLYAKETGITLEITSRKGHSLANGHVAQGALRLGVPLCINTDAHSPGDLISREFAGRVLSAAGIDETRISSLFEHTKAIAEKFLRRD